MRQSNDVNDVMNDVVMVVVHQQKRRVVLCYIRAEYIYIQFVLCYVWATTGIMGMPQPVQIIREENHHTKSSFHFYRRPYKK